MITLVKYGSTVSQIHQHIYTACTSPILNKFSGTGLQFCLMQFVNVTAIEYCSISTQDSATCTLVSLSPLSLVADSQSQISVASTMKVILIGKLQFNDWSLPLVVDLTVFPCSNSLSVYVSLPGIHHCKHVSFSYPRSLLDGAALHTGLSPSG